MSFRTVLVIAYVINCGEVNDEELVTVQPFQKLLSN